jgi:hypothetical protein
MVHFTLLMFLSGVFLANVVFCSDEGPQVQWDFPRNANAAPIVRVIDPKAAIDESKGEISQRLEVSDANDAFGSSYYKWEEAHFMDFSAIPGLSSNDTQSMEGFGFDGFDEDEPGTLDFWEMNRQDARKNKRRHYTIFDTKTPLSWITQTALSAVNREDVGLKKGAVDRLVLDYGTEFRTVLPWPPENCSIEVPIFLELIRNGIHCLSFGFQKGQSRASQTRLVYVYVIDDPHAIEYVRRSEQVVQWKGASDDGVAARMNSKVDDSTALNILPESGSRSDEVESGEPVTLQFLPLTKPRKGYFLRVTAFPQPMLLSAILQVALSELDYSEYCPVTKSADLLRISFDDRFVVFMAWPITKLTRFKVPEDSSPFRELGQHSIFFEFGSGGASICKPPTYAYKVVPPRNFTDVGQVTQYKTGPSLKKVLEEGARAVMPALPGAVGAEYRFGNTGKWDHEVPEGTLAALGELYTSPGVHQITWRLRDKFHRTVEAIFVYNISAPKSDVKANAEDDVAEDGSGTSDDIDNNGYVLGSLSTTGFAGIVLGGVAVIVLAVGVIIVVRRKRESSSTGLIEEGE